jgi:type IX secretion system PorP/SprF family membrane protein
MRKYRPTYLYKGLLAVTMLSLSFLELSGQEQAYFSQYMHNRMLYNPAFAGDREIPGFSFHSRQQWMSWEGSPSANLLMAHTRLKNKNAGIGVSFSYDRMGPVQHAGFSGAYSYTIQVTDKSRLMMGLQGEMRILQIRLSQLQLVDQGDLLFEVDPGMKVQPNVGFGINYQFQNYSVNFSIPRILNSKLSPYEGETSKWSRTHRVFYLEASSGHNISESIKLKPSVLVALASGTSPFVELAGMFLYREKFGAGMFYRFDKTLGGMIRYNHQDRITVGYSYDVSLGYTQYNAGTHELFLGYNFPFNRVKTVSPRKF